jgi:hypothetical protein
MEQNYKTSRAVPNRPLASCDCECTNMQTSPPFCAPVALETTNRPARPNPNPCLNHSRQPCSAVRPSTRPRVPAMAHGGGLPRRGAAVRRPKSAASSSSADRKRKRPAAVKSVSLKNLIRSTERFLRKVLSRLGTSDELGPLSFLAIVSVRWLGFSSGVLVWEPLDCLANWDILVVMCWNLVWLR